MKRARRPLELSLRLGYYILKNRLKGRKKFPLVTMLEPLEMCNLACVGCGRIREYKPVLDKMMSVEVALDAVKQSGAPIVSIAGGEPTIHPRIDQIINRLLEQKYFVYCCTNALLMERILKKVAPSKYLCWVIHLDGMEAKHDESVDRPRMPPLSRPSPDLAAAWAGLFRFVTIISVFGEMRLPPARRQGTTSAGAKNPTQLSSL